MNSSWTSLMIRMDVSHYFERLNGVFPTNDNVWLEYLVYLATKIPEQICWFIYISVLLMNVHGLNFRCLLWTVKCWYSDVCLGVGWVFPIFWRAIQLAITCEIRIEGWIWMDVSHNSMRCSWLQRCVSRLVLSSPLPTVGYTIKMLWKK